MENLADVGFSVVAYRRDVEAGIVYSEYEFVFRIAVEVVSEHRVGLDDVPKNENVPLCRIVVRNLFVYGEFRTFLERQTLRRISEDFVDVGFAVVATELETRHVFSKRGERGEFLTFLVGDFEDFAFFRNPVFRPVIRVYRKRRFGFSVFVECSFRSYQRHLLLSDGNHFHAFYESAGHSSDVLHFRKDAVRRNRSFEERTFLVSRPVPEPSEFRGGRREIDFVVSVAVEIREFDEVHRRDLIVALAVERHVPDGLFSRFDVNEVEVSVSLGYRSQVRFAVRGSERTIPETVILGRIHQSRNHGRARRRKLVNPSGSEGVLAGSEFASCHESPVSVFAKFLGDVPLREHVFGDLFREIVESLGLSSRNF